MSDAQEQPTPGAGGAGDVGELERKARRATPGPWVWHTSNSWRRLKRDAQGILQNVAEPYVVRHDNHPDLCIEQADMDYIAAANPTAVLALIAERDALRAAVEKMVREGHCTCDDYMSTPAGEKCYHCQVVAALARGPVAGETGDGGGKANGGN